jgi:hypothetical protein
MPAPTFLDRNGLAVERASFVHNEISEALQAYLREICLADPRRLHRPISGILRDLAEYYSQTFD